MKETNNKVSYVIEQLPKVHATHKKETSDLKLQHEDAEGEMDKMHAFEDELDNFDKELASIMKPTD